MNIAFDGVAILGAMGKNRGIGNYAMAQMNTILHKDRENQYFFLNCIEKTSVFKEEVKRGLLKEEYLPYIKDGTYLPFAERKEIYGRAIRNFLKRNRINVFYITSPFDNSVPPYEKDWFEGVQVVAIVYDIIPYVMKEHYFPDATALAMYMERVEELRWANRLITISESAKDDLIEYLGFSPEKIDVIWGAPGRQFKEITITTEEKNAIRRKFNITKDFVMCTGGDDERKNIAGLIQAFGNLPKDLQDSYQLVIVCKLGLESIKRYSELAQTSGVADSVLFTNFVTDQELLQLYNLASLMAFPSKYEGFGLPIVEAWACGTPVLTSKNSSLGQIGGEAAILVDPYLIEDISRGLIEALNKARIAELTQLGQKRLKLFQWDKVAQLTMDAFGKTGKGSWQKPGKNIRRRIAFFTPLPPQQSGISDYSVDILNALSSHYDIDVFVDDGYEVTCSLSENIQIFLHKEYKRYCQTYWDTIFQMGNSRYHVYMWPYVQKFGGTVVLHDYNMHGVFQDVALAQSQGDFELYHKMLAHDLTEAMVSRYMRGIEKGRATQLYEIELNGYIVNYVERIIVHSEEAYRKLLTQDIGRKVAVIRSYTKIGPLPDTRAAKERLNIPENAFVFAAFGHVHPAKRIIPIMRAFARLARENETVLLIFGGQLVPGTEKAFWDECQELGLNGQVAVTGYISLDEFETYIDAADVCMNLRWPYNGETSGSLMRILGKGKCVVVNDMGSFGEIPDEACVKLPPVNHMTEREEIDSIYQAMRKLSENPAHREALQKNARRYAEENLDLDIVAKQYADFIDLQEEPVLTDKLLLQIKRALDEKKATPEEISSIAKLLANLAR